MKEYINCIWCYRKDCEFYVPSGKDGEGEFGMCTKEEVMIDRYGKCRNFKEDEDILDEDKNFEMNREEQDYINEISDYSFRLKSVASRAFQPKECSPTLNILPTTFYIAQDCGNNFIRCQRTINNNSILGAENKRPFIPAVKTEGFLVINIVKI